LSVTNEAAVTRGRPARWASGLRGPVSSAGLRLMPRLPTGAKWLMTRGHAVVLDSNTLDRTLQVMLAGQRAFGIQGLVVDDDPSASRTQMRRLASALERRQIHVAVSDVTIPGPAGGLAGRHYRPAGNDAAPLLVFFHGGGFVLGDLDTHDALCRLTCREAGIHVLSVDYRRAPEHPAPAAVDDAYAAFAWACAHAAELGAVPGRVAVGGDSAGANLAAVVARLTREAGAPAPVLQWLLYPLTDATAQTRSRTLFADGFLLTKHDIEWMQHRYLHGSGVEPTDPRVSPLLADDLSGLAPALIATAGFDVLRDEGQQYAAALQAAGTAVDLRHLGSLIHGFANLFPLGGAGATATTELISALRAHLSRV
jgi:acetyl esterase/lipase